MAVELGGECFVLLREGMLRFLKSEGFTVGGKTVSVYGT